MLHQIIPVKTAQATAQGNASPPIHQISCSFTEFQRLESAIADCIGIGAHCAECHRVAQYANNFRKLPHLVHVSWNGVSTVNPKALNDYLRVVATFAENVQLGKMAQDETHQQVVAVVAAFLEEQN